MVTNLKFRIFFLIIFQKIKKKKKKKNNNKKKKKKKIWFRLYINFASIGTYVVFVNYYISYFITIYINDMKSYICQFCFLRF